MRGGLRSHPSLEPCSESLSWSQPTGLNCPAEESLNLGASHNSDRGKTPMVSWSNPHSRKGHQGQNVQPEKSSDPRTEFRCTISRFRSVDCDCHIITQKPRPNWVLRLPSSDYWPTSPPVWQSRTTMQHSTCPPEEKHCPLGLPRNPK